MGDKSATELRYKEIQMSNNKSLHAIVDEQYYPLLYLHKWRAQKNWYAETQIGNRTIRMHEMVLPKKPNTVIDHINFNKLDNRSENLRLLKNIENLHHNKNRMREDVGVNFHHHAQKWRARTSKMVNGKKTETHIGLFKTKDEAIAARKEYLLRLEVSNEV